MPNVDNAQPLTSALERRTWDSIVVGAGPCGAIAAGILAGRGLDVLLVDRKVFPREKVCGDGLNHDAVGLLRELELLGEIESRAHRVGATVVYSSGRARVRLPGPYYTLERRALDDLLCRWAVSRGARLALGDVVAFDQPGRDRVRLTLRGGGACLETRSAILATGAGIGIARRAGFELETAPSAVAIRCYARSGVELETLVGAYDEGVLPGYGWIFPMGGGRFNVGVIGYYDAGRRTGPPLRERLRRFLESVPEARALLAQGELSTSPRSAPLRCGLPRGGPRGRGRVLLAGELIGTTYHFIGEGIGKAMESGRIAAECLAGALGTGADPVGPYAERLRFELEPKYAFYRLAQRWLAGPAGNEVVGALTARNAGLSSLLEKIVVREEFPDRRSILQSWLYRS